MRWLRVRKCTFTDISFSATLCRARVQSFCHKLWIIYSCPCVHAYCLFSHVRLRLTLWTLACQASLSMGFTRQEYWSGLHAFLQEISSTWGCSQPKDQTQVFLCHCQKNLIFNSSHPWDLNFFSGNWSSLFNFFGYLCPRTMTSVGWSLALIWLRFDILKLIVYPEYMSVLSLLLSLLLKIKQNYISGLRQNHTVSEKQSNFLLLLFFKTTPSVMALSSILSALGQIFSTRLSVMMKCCAVLHYLIYYLPATCDHWAVEMFWTNVTEERIFYLLKNIYLFIWLHCIFVVAHKIFDCSMQTFSFSMWDLVPWPMIKPGSPALGMWSLSHWTTRKVS